MRPRRWLKHRRSRSPTAPPPCEERSSQIQGREIETVTPEKGDDEPDRFWAEAKVDGRLYAIGVLEDGTLSEMNLAVDDAELKLERLPFGSPHRPPGRVD